MKYLIKWFLGWVLSLRYNRKKGELYYIVWGHIGEAVYALSLLPELNRIKGKRINIITFSPYSQIAELYKDQYKDIIILSSRKVNFIKEYARSNVIMHHNYIGSGWEWEANALYADVSDVYVPGLNYKIKDLKIPYSTKHSLITSPVDKNEEIFMDLVKKYEVLEKKSVLLIPYAQSAKQLDASFWEKVATILNNNGYKVYTNIKDESENVIKGTQGVVIPLRYVNTFIEYAGSAISIRCGLTDLIAVSHNDVEVLYRVENMEDDFMAKIWSFKLGKENVLYKNRWLFREQEDYIKFYSYIENKYAREKYDRY